MTETPIATPIVVMGVSGSGKTTVGRALAEKLDVPFVDADDLHPRANIEKMAAGCPLDDADRAPWLDAVGRWLAKHPRGVIACSALTRAYRDRIRTYAPDAWFVCLVGSKATIAQRIAIRSDHFMPTALLDSQIGLLQALEGDESGVVLDVELPVDDLVASVTSSVHSLR